MRRGVVGLASLLWVVQATMRGVPPEKEASYSGATFKCLDGKSEVPSSAVNDDFCDCADGSDEPGTGACAGQDASLFHCANAGATPQLVYASRVDDGICDCCDGSDEAGLSARQGGRACANRCAEEGAKDQQERADRIEKLKVGLQKKAEIIAAAEVDKNTWTGELARLKEELPGLESALEEAKSAEATKTATDCAPCQAEVESLKTKVASLEKEVASLKAKLQAGGGDGSEDDTPKPAGEKKVVSEYAKWMEGAGSTPGAIDGATEEPAADSGAASGALEEDEDEDSLGPTKPVTASFTSGLNKGAAVTDAERKVRENKDAARKLEKKLEQISDADKLGFASLVDKCLSKHDGQYDYKACFFDNAKQDHVLLGSWKGWTGPKEALFSNGHMCPGGPERELKVVFECGSSEEVVDVSEPSRCSYQARVSHPGACSQEDMAALEKPPVKHPKDEL